MSYHILNIGQQVYVDNSITSISFHSHPPYSNTSLNKSDEIRLPIQTQDSYTWPSRSYLNITGKLVTTTDKNNTTSQNIQFINNGIMHLFDEIRYELGGIVIDRVRNPGITSTIKGYASFMKGDTIHLENAGWNHKETPNIVDSNGNFNVIVPLSMLLGFFEDFKQIIINIRQELVLIRNSTDINATIKTAENGEKIKPVITFEKIIWEMAHVKVSDEARLTLFNYIDKGVSLHVPFRSWELHEHPYLQQSTMHTWNIKATNQLEKPRYVIVGFQTNRKNNIDKNMSHFDHCKLINMTLYINSNAYPYNNLNLNFDKRQWAILYEMYARFQQTYYLRETSEPCLNLKQFCNEVPIIVLDCSKQNEVIKSGSVDIRLEFQTADNIPTNTAAYCLIIHDRLVTYEPLRSLVSIVV